MRKTKLKIFMKSMRNEIIDYLTLQHLKDPNFDAPMCQRVRRAWMLAKSRYDGMSAEEKREMYMYISMKKSSRSYD